MKKINKRIELNTNDENKQLILDFGNLYDNNYVLSVSVTSREVSSRSSCIFIGQSSWVEFLRNEIEVFIKQLQNLMNYREGVARINDTESDDFLIFEASPLGQVVVRGQVGGSHRDHCMKFTFETDQTVLAVLVNDLKSVLELKDEESDSR